MSAPRMLQSLLSRLITPAVRHALVEADHAKPGYGPVGTTEQLQGIFANYPSAKGLMLDFLDPSNIYQDSLGTTPVTTSGQPIGYAADLSGRAAHFIPASTGARPIWNGQADFDGINHWGTVDYGIAESLGPVVFGAKVDYISGVSRAGVYAIGISPNSSDIAFFNVLEYRYGNAVSVTSPALSTVGLHTLLCSHNGGTSDALYSIDEGEEITLANPGSGTASSSSRYVSLGCQTRGGGNRAKIKVSKVFHINASLTPDERAMVRAWLGKPL